MELNSSSATPGSRNEPVYDLMAELEKALAARPGPVLGVNASMTAKAIEGYLKERENIHPSSALAIAFKIFEWRDILLALNLATASLRSESAAMHQVLPLAPQPESITTTTHGPDTPFKYRMILKFDGFERVVESEYPAPVSARASPPSVCSPFENSELSSRSSSAEPNKEVALRAAIHLLKRVIGPSLLDNSLQDQIESFLRGQGEAFTTGLPSLPSATAPTKHWVYAAAEAHRPLLEKVASVRHDALGHEHTRWMLDKIRDGGFSPTKACRWLGWVQAALNLDGVPLDRLKEINKNASLDRRNDG